MQLYIHEATQRYPLTVYEIRAENPQTSFPQYIQHESAIYLGYIPVTRTAPTYDADLQYTKELAPVKLSDSEYEQVWDVLDYTQEELDQRAAEAAAAEAATQEAIKQQLIQSVTQQTQQRLDDFAKTRNYDGILSACTYATSPTAKFATEGQYCVEARDATWSTLYVIMAEVEAGTRPMPSSFADIEPDLPVLTWPI